jgi:hypothetical protein
MTAPEPDPSKRGLAWIEWIRANAVLCNTDHLSFKGGYDAGVAAGSTQALEEAADEMEERFRARLTLGMPTDEWLRARAAAIQTGANDE